MLALLIPFGFVPISELSPLLIMRYRETACESRDPGEGPAVCQAVGMKELIERKLILIADDEVVFYIERRDAIAERGIEGVDLLAGVR